MFVFFVQTTCSLSMKMYNGVLRNSAEINALAKDFVCILCYKELNQDDWNRGSVFFLPQSFYTPVCVFADSNGTELLPDLRAEMMHREFPEKKLAETFRKALKQAGKGMPRDKWKAVRKQLREAEEAFECSDATRALQLLDAVTAENAVPRLTGRAKRRRIELSDYAFLLREAARLDQEGAIRKYSDLARAYAGRPEGEEAMKKLAEHGISEPVPPSVDGDLIESGEIYRRAVNAALRGDVLSARDEMSFFVDAADEPKRHPKHLALYDRLSSRCEDAFSAGRVKITKVFLRNTGQKYWEIGVTVGSRLSRVDCLTIQYWVLTGPGNVFAAYQTFGNVERGHRHQHAAYLPFSDLGNGTARGEDDAEVGVKDVYFEVFVSNEVVACASLSSSPKRAWWMGTVVKPLAFIDVPGWGWDSGTLTPVEERGVIYGSDDARVVQGGSDRDSPPLPARIENAIGAMGRSVDPAEIGTAWRELLDIGDAAVAPLRRALDPEGGEYTVNYALLLCDMKAREAIPDILQLLKAKDDFIREEIPAGLLRFGDGHVVPVDILTKQLDDEKMWPRFAAAMALGYLRDEKGVGPLITRLAVEKDSAVRNEIINALSRITINNFGLDGNRSVSEQEVPYKKLARWWKAHSKETRETWMVAALNDAGYKIPKPDDLVNGRVSVEVEEALRKAALDGRWWISYAAMRLLVGLNNPDTIPTFLDVLRKTKRNDLRYAALRGITAVAHRDSLEDLISVAEDEKELTVDVISILEDLLGIYTRPASETGDLMERMAPWRDWVQENDFYIYRPEGSPRFLINEKAMQEATVVDPVTGKPEE
jgi:HEAT repeat protein